jgi:hypothetical protein
MNHAKRELEIGMFLGHGTGALETKELVAPPGYRLPSMANARMLCSYIRPTLLE